MEFTIDRAEVLKGLYLTQSVVERRTTQPILSHILLEAAPPILNGRGQENPSPHEGWVNPAHTMGGVKLTATDMEVGIEIILPATVTEPGSLCLGAKKTYEIIRELPEQIVQFIKKEGNWLEIQCGKALFRLMTLPPEEFPQLSFSHIGTPFSLEAQTLKEMIDKTIFAVSDDETKPILNGALLELDKCPSSAASSELAINEEPRNMNHETRTTDILRMVATDGHRLAMIERPLPVARDPSSVVSYQSYEENTTDHKLRATDILSQGIVLPKKALIELCRLLESGEISISFSDAAGIVKAESSKLKARSSKLEDTLDFSAFSLFMGLLQGEFPDYRKVIPSSQGSLTIKIDRTNLLNTLKRISTLSTDRYKIVKLSIGNGEAIISVVNPDLGEAKENLEIDYQGPNLEMGFNAFYLLEALNSISSAQVSIELKDEISATLIKAWEGRDHQLNLIMPIRI